MRPRVIASLLAVALTVAPTVDAQIVHVDADAPGPVHDGATWCTAYQQLHAALAAATPGSSVHIAAGSYRPDPTGLADPREATFALPGGLDLRGGYAGCGEPDPDRRDPLAYPTVLSGDLAGDDPIGGRDDNAYTVVTAAQLSGTVILDGLVIRGGEGEGERTGGGLQVLGSTVHLLDCTLEDNRSWRGGAIYAEAAALQCHRCRFRGNTTTGEGGAIFHATAGLVLDTCLLALNTAGSDGGAVFSDLAQVQVLGCSLGGNTSGGRGGAIYDYVGVETQVVNTILWGNLDTFGAGETSQIFLNPSNLLHIDHSCVQGWSGAFGGEGNLGGDPLLRDLAAGDLHLAPGSPCIDAGDDGMVFIQLDLDGNPRIVGEHVDLGCYEAPAPTGVREARGAAGILGVTANPGAPRQWIRFRPPARADWSLELCDLRGRRLARLDGGAGEPAMVAPREVSWNGRQAGGRRLPAGIYLAVLRQDDRIIDAARLVRLR